MEFVCAIFYKETDYPESLNANNNNKGEPGEVNICLGTALEANDKEQVISRDNNPAIEFSRENITNIRREKGVQSDLNSNALEEETQTDDRARRKIVQDNIKPILAPQIQIAGHAQGGATELCQRGLTSKISNSNLLPASVSIATTENCGSVGGLESTVRTLARNEQSEEKSLRDPANCSEQTDNEVCQISTAMNLASKEGLTTSYAEFYSQDQQLESLNTFDIDTNTSGNEKDLDITVSRKTSSEFNPGAIQSYHYATMQFQEQSGEIETQLEKKKKLSENGKEQENEVNNSGSNEATSGTLAEAEAGTETNTQTEAESMCHDLNSSSAAPLFRPQPSGEGSKQHQPDLVSFELVEHETEFKNTLAKPLLKDAEQINLDEQSKLDEDDTKQVSVGMKTPQLLSGK